MCRPSQECRLAGTRRAAGFVVQLLRLWRPPDRDAAAGPVGPQVQCTPPQLSFPLFIALAPSLPGAPGSETAGNRPQWPAISCWIARRRLADSRVR